jgi:hypothetical protein
MKYLHNFGGNFTGKAVISKTQKGDGEKNIEINFNYMVFGNVNCHQLSRGRVQWWDLLLRGLKLRAVL